jgi:hypothetical protein
VKLWRRVLRGLIGAAEPGSRITLSDTSTTPVRRCPVCMEPLANLPSTHQYKIEKDATYCWTP